MNLIHLETIIHAPQQICFDLSRSVVLHVMSTSHTNERVVQGRSAGLFEEGDIVTWRARHFGIYQQLTMQVYNVQPCQSFEDKMLKGVFKSIRHKHSFEFLNGHTMMRDEFYYETPYGIAGRVFNRVILKKYMTRLLQKRNTVIKDVAESGKWKEVLHG